MTNCVLGIDVGTSGVKVLLVDAAGVVRAASTQGYPLSNPKPLWSEQDPIDWWEATVRGIQDVLGSDSSLAARVVAVGLTGQMHGLVLLDAQGGVLRPAILWNDQRTAGECAAIETRLGRDTILQVTGKPVLPSFTAPKILWVREHEPEVYQSVAQVLLPKDYVRYRLSGSYAIDVADASGTSLFDVRRRDWSERIVDELDIPRAWLPPVTECRQVSSLVSANAAQQTGLVAGTPVVAGAGDQAAEAVGCGVVDEGAVSVTIGTSGVVFAATRQPLIDEAGRLHTYCHARPGMWHLMGVMLSAGGSLQWYRNELCADEVSRASEQGDDPYNLLTRQAAEIGPGCEGLVFLPYLTGERTPHPDPLARGAFVGLTRRHHKAHMTRAVLEGVCFGLRDCLELLRAMNLADTKVRVSGGGARSAIWRQMLADVLQAEVATVNATQGAAFGAALLAMVGAGMFEDIEAAAASVVCEETLICPDAQAATAYEATYEIYCDLYGALKPHFASLHHTAE